MKNSLKQNILSLVTKQKYPLQENESNTLIKYSVEPNLTNILPFLMHLFEELPFVDIMVLCKFGTSKIGSDNELFLKVSGYQSTLDWLRGTVLASEDDARFHLFYNIINIENCPRLKDVYQITNLRKNNFSNHLFLKVKA